MNLKNLPIPGGSLVHFNTRQTLIPTQPDSPSCLERTRGEIRGNKQERRKESYEPSRLHQQKRAPYKIFYFLFTPSRLHIMYCCQQLLVLWGSLILFLYFKHFENQKNQWFWVFKKFKRTGSFHERRKEPTKNWQFKVGSLTQFFDILKHCSSMYYNFFRKLVMGWVPELILFDFEKC